MSANRMPNGHDGQGEVNLRLSAEDFSGLDPDAQSLLRQLAASQQEQQRRQPAASSSYLGRSPTSLPGHGRDLIQRPVSLGSAAGPPGSNTHRTLPNNWQHQAALQEPTGMGLDDFGQSQDRSVYRQ